MLISCTELENFFSYFNVIFSVLGFIMMNVEWLLSLSLVTLTSGQMHTELSKSVEFSFVFYSVCWFCSGCFDSGQVE